MGDAPNGLRFLEKSMSPDQFRETFDSLTSYGWLSEPEARLLVDSAAKTSGHMLEIGSYCGRSAKLLGTLAKLQGRELHCIDPWGDFGLPETSGNQAFERFKAEVANLPVAWWRSTLEGWVGTSWDYGFVYCDGDHSYQGTWNQIDNATKHSPQVIAVHDVNDSGGGVAIKKACLELLGPWTERIERLAVWVR